MPDSTYTANGTFTDERIISLKICIPSEPFKGAYNTELYNLSKSTSSGNINALFCHFSNQSPTAMEHNSFDYNMEFDLDQVKQHPDAVPFDETLADCVFIFFHNDDFRIEDREAYFSDIENIYINIKNNGNLSQDGMFSTKLNASSRVPRKVGMSLIGKS